MPLKHCQDAGLPLRPATWREQVCTLRHDTLLAHWPLAGEDVRRDAARRGRAYGSGRLEPLQPYDANG